MVLSLSAGVVLAALSVRGYSLLRRRPGLPAGIEARTVVRVDDFEVVRPTDIEFILSRYEVGESAAFVLRHGDGVVSRTASFAPFFGQGLYPHVGLAVGLFSYALGFLVFLLRWEDPRARLLYGLAVVFAYTLTVHGGTYVLGRGWLSVPIAAVFYLCYPLAPAILLHFSLTFSGRPRALFLAPVYALFLGFGVFFAASVLTFFLRGSISAFRIYFDVFQAFRMAMIALLLLSFVAFVLAYCRASLEEDRARLKWVFLGLLAGLGPFILLDQGFLALGFRPFLSEESATVFFVFIPLGFAFSLFRFRLLDVEVVINRSLVYSTLTIFTAGLYLFSVRLLQSLLSETLALRGTMASLGSALIAASAFHPARRRIQTAVDKAFFRSSYDSKKAVLRYAELCQGETDGGALVAGLAEGLETVIPVERLAVAVHEAGPEGRRFLYGRGWKEGESRPDLRGRPAGRFWA
ncbi:MAG: hypothetical protein FJY80_09235, partial [Candidatus Aminicenantes bacterium]|nr:hypothetical protein [Candidatus Aminicenantes bacterium]